MNVCIECNGSGEEDRIEYDSIPCGACYGEGVIDQDKVAEMLNLPLGPNETSAGRLQLIMILMESGFLDVPKKSLLTRASECIKNLKIKFLNLKNG